VQISGFGREFLDQDFVEAWFVVDTSTSVGTAKKADPADVAPGSASTR
jgi:hypothetical protein